MRNIQLVLASASPRRQMLLSQIGLNFEICPSNVHEPPFTGGQPSDYARDLARDKTNEIASTLNNRLVVGADTIVVVDDEVLGKPVDNEDAMRMLNLLSGRTHEVVTAYNLQLRDEHIDVMEHVSTAVHFKQLSEEEIRRYVDSGAPMDKAGAYGIQDFSGVFVDRIQGCFYNVVGLPLADFNTTLQSVLKQHNLQLSS